MTDVAVLIPVLRRPHRVKPVLDSLRNNTPGGWRALFICDPDDLPQQQAVRDQGADMLLIDGNYAQKINAGVRVTTEPYLFLGADDLAFHPDWLPIALAEMTDKIGVVGTNDLGSPRVLAGEHATHSLVARWYTDLGTIDEPDKLLHESYPHEFVDDEFVQTARARNAFVSASHSIVEHLHPNWGKAPTDDLYDQQRARMRRGRRIFYTRRPMWT